MSERLARIFAGVSGVLGGILLAIYFAAPNAMSNPLPGPEATPEQIIAYAAGAHDLFFLGTWIQATGTLLTVVFFLSLVDLAGAASRLAGRLVALGSGVLLTVVLIEGVFTLGAVQGATSGHPATAQASWDVMNLFIHIFPLAPAPLVFLSLGTVLVGSRVLPRIFGYLALALGVGFELVGLASLVSSPALALVVILLIGQELWILAAAILLLARPYNQSGLQ